MKRSIAISLITLALLTIRAEAAQAVVTGDNPQAITAYFPSVIDSNFSNSAAVNAVIGRLTNQEVASLRKTYAYARGGNGAQLDAAVRTYGSPSSQAKWFQQPLQPAQNYMITVAGRAVAARPVAVAGPAPTIDYTIYEIYLEFRTAAGALTPAAALAETAIFVAGKVSVFAGAGIAIGTGIHNLIEYFDPGIDDVIGGTLDAMMQNLEAASTDASSAQYKKAIRDLFGVPTTPLLGGGGAGGGGTAGPIGGGGAAGSGQISLGGGGRWSTITIECCVDLGGG